MSRPPESTVGTCTETGRDQGLPGQSGQEEEERGSCRSWVGLAQLGARSGTREGLGRDGWFGKAENVAKTAGMDTLGDHTHQFPFHLT